MVVTGIILGSILTYLLIVSLLSGFFKVATRYDIDEYTIDSEYINEKNVNFEDNTYELDGETIENIQQRA